MDKKNKSNLSLRGQVTLFMITGIVLIAVVAFALASFRLFSTEKLQQQQHTITRTFTETPAVQHYVSVCVEDALKKSIDLIGRQGGYIFMGQPGGIFTPEHTFFRGAPLAFGITTPAQSMSPLYPCSASFVDQAPAYCRYPYSLDYFSFGTSLLPPLEGGVFSIQQQIERYITSYVRGCVNITSLMESESFRGVSITAGEPHASVRFGSLDVSVRVDYPILLSVGGSEPVTQFVSFDAHVPVRFKRLYDAVQDIASKDISFSDFHVNRDSITPFFKGGLVKFSTLSPSVSLTLLSFDVFDVLLFNDSSSLIENSSYSFFLLRKNRAPVLDYVARNPSVQNVYDFLLVSGEEITANFTASDPDEDTITFFTSGDFSSASGNSSVFNTPPLTPGYYSQLVNVSDGFSSDWQAVRVLIDPLLSPRFTLRHLLNGIPTGVASREDPFFLDASLTNTTLDPFADYTYFWHAPLFGMTDYACVVFPSYGRCTDALPSPNTITQFYNGTSSGRFTIELTVNLTYNGRSQQSSAGNLITIVPCFPHTNSSDPFPSPYSTGQNTYAASHLCCIGDPSGDPASWRVASKNELACSPLLSADQQCVNGSLLLSQRQKRVMCDGVRGNICNELPDQSNVNVSGVQISNNCGANTQPGCFGIAFECQNKISYALLSGQGWCSGVDGCAVFCPLGTPIVDINSNGVADAGDACGCVGHVGAACDEDADNTFGGVCASMFGVNYCTDGVG